MDARRFAVIDAVNERPVSGLDGNIAIQPSNASVEGETDKADRFSEASHSDGEVVIRDPLRWFGILVPPALRSAQGEFTKTVTDVLPGLVQAQRDIEYLEEAIGKARQRRKTNENT
ncbi:MAG: hypothetical protein M1832_006297 [Thelocarpon impressellum]|nr:MAG: hypothetical protein M1832_006297 [Thelocarpon impressellum]